tara:strand:+ start:206 stop:706 length:501 start_codon:yes stop_codon:yes gene_type:complete
MILVKSLKRNNNFLKYYDDNYLKAIRAFSLFLPTQISVEIKTDKEVDEISHLFYEDKIEQHQTWINYCYGLMYSRVPIFMDTFTYSLSFDITDEMYNQYAIIHEVSLKEAKKECDLIQATAREWHWKLFCLYSKIRNDINNAATVLAAKEAVEKGRQILFDRLHVL